MGHDRRHDLNADPPPAAGEAHDRRHDRTARLAQAHDPTGERHLSLSAKSLAARGDAPDGSEDGQPRGEGEPG
jgi:hypothetical protein